MLRVCVWLLVRLEVSHLSVSIFSRGIMDFMESQTSTLLMETNAIRPTIQFPVVASFPSQFGFTLSRFFCIFRDVNF